MPGRLEKEMWLQNKIQLSPNRLLDSIKSSQGNLPSIGVAGICEYVTGTNMDSILNSESNIFLPFPFRVIPFILGWMD